MARVSGLQLQPIYAQPDDLMVSLQISSFAERVGLRPAFGSKMSLPVDNFFMYELFDLLLFSAQDLSFRVFSTFSAHDCFRSKGFVILPALVLLF